MLSLRKYILILFSFLGLFVISAEEKEIFEQKYKLACEIVEKGDYKESEALFRELISITPTSQIGTNSRFMLGYVFYNQGKYTEAITQFNEFIRRVPKSVDADWALYYIGNAYFQQNRFFDAAKAYFQAFKTESEKLKPALKQTIANLLWGYLTLDELFRLRRILNEEPEEEIVSYYIIKRLEHQKATAALFEEAENFLNKYPGSENRQTVENTFKKLENELLSELTIAVILPFSGNFKEYGEKMYKGIELALKEYKRISGKAIKIEKGDTKGDPLTTVMELKNILQRTKPIAIIGPLRSETAIPAAVVATNAGVPMITPSASRDGISRIGYGIFQLSPSLEEKCKALASYAINELGYSTFAVLATNDEYGIKAGKSFSSKIKELGGAIVGEYYYPEGTLDLTSYIDSIRAPLVKLMSTYTKADSTDTVFYDKFRRLKPPNEWIVHIDGFFVPSYASEIQNILPQIPFRYIDTKFLGAIGWKDELIANKLIKEYIDGAVFVPDEFYIDTLSSAWKNFERLYKTAYPQDKPNRFSALGYDAANIILDGLKKKAFLPSLMADFIAGITEYKGASGTISLNSYGASESVPILKIEGKQVVRVK